MSITIKPVRSITINLETDTLIGRQEEWKFDLQENGFTDIHGVDLLNCIYCNFAGQQTDTEVRSMIEDILQDWRTEGILLGEAIDVIRDMLK